MTASEGLSRRGSKQAFPVPMLGWEEGQHPEDTMGGSRPHGEPDEMIQALGQWLAGVSCIEPGGLGTRNWGAEGTVHSLKP